MLKIVNPGFEIQAIILYINALRLHQAKPDKMMII